MTEPNEYQMRQVSMGFTIENDFYDYEIELMEQDLTRIPRWRWLRRMGLRSDIENLRRVQVMIQSWTDGGN